MLSLIHILTGKQLTRFFLILTVATAGILVVANVIGRVYPEFAGFLSVERILEMGKSEYGYGNSGYIDRLNFINVIDKYFFSSEGWMRKLFGIGMGNAEYSVSSVFRSSFYDSYGRTFRYLNFAGSDIYLEFGLLGLICYILIFGVLIGQSWKRLQKADMSQEKKYIENIGLAMSVICFIFVAYNNLLRTDIVFAVAPYLAAPFLLDKGVSVSEYGKHGYEYMRKRGVSIDDKSIAHRIVK